MSYTELYIESMRDMGPLVSGSNSIYLLPGLIDYHTPCAIPEEELLECKQEYNRYLEMVKHDKEKLVSTPEDESKIKDIMEYHLEMMHDLLQKIGCYTREDMQKGFRL
jgi:hypothetical protein